MSYTMSNNEFESIVKMNTEERLQYFMAKVGETGELWSLKDRSEWVVVGSDEAECIPVWPHPKFALSWAGEEWSDCYPDSIKLDHWMSQWLPGMQRDGVKVVVFPNRDDEGVLADPQRFLEALSSQIEA